ncbi:MAG: selenide, water dikinase SelD, partial [Planctomycetota bacterium]
VEEMEIDLVRLANSAGARLILDEVVSLDPANQQLIFKNRPPLRYDALSIGIGSRPSFNGVNVSDDANLLAVKPMQTFLTRLREKLAALESRDKPRKILVVGGGLGSIEIAFCMKHRLKSDPDWTGPIQGNAEVELITGSERIGAGLLKGTQDRVAKQLSQRGIALHTGRRVASIDAQGLVMTDGSRIDGDLVIWVTSAVPPALVENLNLETDEAGFISTRPTLQSLTSERVFSVGDTGTMIDSPTAKAGVFAVRQGPVLWENIQRLLDGRSLEPYVPQRGFLKLINTGDDRAVAEYAGRSFYGGWCWKLKDRIDVKFMKMYQDYSLMEMAPEPVDPEEEMRCLGCGGKVGSQILSSILEELDVRPSDEVIIGLDKPDDAAIVKAHDNQVTVTTDFFASPFDDPYLVGRIATLNSASDCFVMGAQPTAALAIVQLPLGHPRGQRQVMRELMAGSVEELNRMGATIVGGHTIEGPRTMVGYTILGRQVVDPKTKSGLRVGDQLILTKPIGTGVLLAALMQSKLPGTDYQPLIDSMLLSNQIALDIVKGYPIGGLTDVTGFGLAGHLAEMLKASGVSARITMGWIPMMSGCQELIESGIESTLADDNRAVAGSVRLSGIAVNDKRIASLFDPQTGGGLLIGISKENANRLLGFLMSRGMSRAAIIGEVTECDGEVSELVVNP